MRKIQKPFPEPRNTLKQSPLSAEGVTERNVRTIADIEAKMAQQRSPTYKFADKITGFCGSLQFVYFHFITYGAWIAFNCCATLFRFDPYPFPFLNFVMGLEAIFLSTFILISQNHQSAIAKKRNHLDLQINLLSEQENSKMLSMLEKISDRLGLINDPEVAALKKATKPETLADQIEDILEEPPKL